MEIVEHERGPYQYTISLGDEYLDYEIVGPEIKYTLQSDIIEWIDDNIDDSDNHVASYYRRAIMCMDLLFERREDAIVFKMRWG